MLTSQSQLDWRATDDGLKPFLVEGNRVTEVAWAPQPGSQVALLSCPVHEILLEGNRGGGKTDVFIFKFGQHIGQGYGAHWRGIIFRRTYPELRDLIDKCRRWIPRIWPEAKYNSSEYYWHWPTGEQLFLRHFLNERDYWSYHGHEYPLIGWEELCTHSDDKGYSKMFSCNRSGIPNMPRHVIATANPYGPGHNWVKRRFGLPLPPGRVRGPVMRGLVDKYGEPLPERVAIHSSLTENLVLLQAQPDYLSTLRTAARNDAEYKAWIDGDWNIVAGGMLDDVWDDDVHVIPNLPLDRLPKTWYIRRAFDWGGSKPFSVGWWAESNGEPMLFNNRWYGEVPGDMIRIAEWYGCDPREDNVGIEMPAPDIARGILEREADMGLKGRVWTGPGDTPKPDPGRPGVAGDMAAMGVHWDDPDKGPGSRKEGWQQIRKMLKQAKGPNREHPGIFFCERCTDARRTLPVLPRSDKDLDDVNTESEDHIGDEVRYILRHKRNAISSGVWK